MLQDPNLERYIEEAIKPLQRQIQELKYELKQLQHKVSILSTNNRSTRTK